MIDLSLKPRQLEIIEKYKDFTARHIIPNARKYDQLAEFPWEVVKKAYEEGIMNGPMPVEYGGNGFNLFEGALASEELGFGCIGIGIGIDANTLALTPMYLAASEEQRKKWFGRIVEEKAVAGYCLTEPNAGSDVQGIKTTAIKKGDKYVINGHKRFITNAEVSTVLTVFALTDPERGSRSLSAILVPTNTPGVEIKPRMQKMGQKASVQNEIIFHDVEVPVENLLGSEGQGFVIAMKTFDRTRTGVAALAVGAARRAVETSVTWAKNRIQFGKPIAAQQAVAFMLAEMATKTESARLMTWKAAWEYDTGVKNPGLSSAMAKYWATDMAMEVATDAVQVMAGDGYSYDYDVEKIMRDVKLTQIYEGTNQVQRLVISKSILK
ncbi:MAG: acyl-CoA dehydrogenase family protein [Bacteroidales bacterium]|nr:acyl-CoA dehydrogenase family protein [Bacteroidales bacterium]